MRVRTLSAATAVAGVLVMAAGAPARADVGQSLDLDFSAGLTSDGRTIHDTSGNGRDGRVVSANGGGLTTEWTSHGPGTQFPPACTTADCAAAVVRVPDSPELNPRTQGFTFGARMSLRQDETSQGSNIVQKGFWGDPGGQWKLQVDGVPGRPSCVVAGQRDGAYQRAKVMADRSVADGAWHTVACTRTSTAIEIRIDGYLAGQTAMPQVDFLNTAPVLVGGKGVFVNNDQYHGALSSVFVSVG